jgi:hypothetical protein
MSLPPSSLERVILGAVVLDAAFALFALSIAPLRSDGPALIVLILMAAGLGLVAATIWSGFRRPDRFLTLATVLYSLSVVQIQVASRYLYFSFGLNITLRVWEGDSSTVWVNLWAALLLGVCIAAWRSRASASRTCA